MAWKFIFWGSEEGRKRAIADGKKIAKSRTDFFASCDVISIHVRMKAETKGIITASDFANMRADALFVNSSRAGLLEEGALLDALNNGRPGMAAIDVFPKEPLTDIHNPLLCHPALIATPHIGYVTEDEFNLQFSDIFDQINAFADKKPIHMINPEAFAAI